MSGSYRVLRVCSICGRDFLAFPSAKRCPECKAAMEAEKRGAAGAAEPREDRELADERDGWRHMLRDATGTVIVPGGNVMHALDDLCAYEEACEALGVEGPQQLKNLLAHVATMMPRGQILRLARTGRRPEPRKRKESAELRIEYGVRCCGSCGHYVEERATGRGSAGHCDCHPRMVRSGGGKKGKLVMVPGEFRAVAGARAACRQWTARDTENGERCSPLREAGDVKNGRRDKDAG